MVAALSLFLNLLVLVSPLYMLQVFDRVLPSGHVETLVALTVLAGFALLVFGLLETIRHQTLVRIGAWLDRRLSEPVLAASLGAALTGRATGAEPLRDLARLRAFISSESVLPILDAPWTLVFIVVIWLLHPWLGVLALLGAVLLFALALGSEIVMRAPLGEANERWLAAQRRGETALRNAEVVHAMGMLPALLRRWHADNDRVLDRQAQAGDRGAAIVGMAKFLRQFLQIGVLGLGAYLVLRGELTGGGMIAGSILLGRALAPVEQAIGAWKGLVGARASHDRLQTLLRRQRARRAGCAPARARGPGERRAPGLCAAGRRPADPQAGRVRARGRGGAGGDRPFRLGQIDAVPSDCRDLAAQFGPRPARRRRGAHLGPRRFRPSCGLSAPGRRAVRRHGARQHRAHERRPGRGGDRSGAARRRP